MKKKIRLISLLLVLCVLFCNQTTVQAKTGLDVWDQFAEEFEKNSSLPSSFDNVWDWVKDRGTDAKGLISGIVNSTDRKGYRYNNRPTFPVINAVIDGERGDERAFVTVENVRDEKKHTISVTVKPGIYKITIYAINDCRKAIDAEDVELYIDLPSKVGKGTPAEIKAAISGSNTVPQLVIDGVKLKSKTSYKLKYVDGSLKISSGGAVGGTKLSAKDAFSIDRRVRLGYNSLDGILPAGRKYSCKVTFKIKVTK